MNDIIKKESEEEIQKGNKGLAVMDKLYIVNA